MSKIIAVKFYKTDSGNEPVKEWLYSLEKDERKIIGTDIQTVEFGFPIGMPLVKKIDTKNQLWEVRSHLNSDKIARVIFTIYKDCMILLHGFIKKEQKLPEKDKNIAIVRRKNIDIGECNAK
ncbi:type II toxin-antitoxin system RelE/ParE family toxin [Arcobacter sp. FWKO B]|uniref:type II toxin-antitoxin system RelE/ParE family toxin n=1 Tax=Arcobacter sp. FWKO B TaxID=2593672 RepID=UPI0018A52FA3|nr:type II toxin-antitoxin system RelE/ParE family toxin [Arcobacter sp. FWKO B]QOG11242.1 type II toxin-antitoxin system RelE/ParE family toxin [Arcobacter sp. FWKO B]